MAGCYKVLEVTTTVRFGEKGKGYFKWARADIVCFCSSRGKKTRAHKWRERERWKSCGDRKHSICFGADSSSASHCERKGTARSLIISFEMICSSFQPFRAQLSLSEHPHSTVTKIQSWLWLVQTLKQGHKETQERGRTKQKEKENNTYKSTLVEIKISADSFTSISLPKSFFQKQVEETH